MRNRPDTAPSRRPQPAASQPRPPALARGPSPRLAPPPPARRRRDHAPRLVRALGSACGPGQPTSLPEGRSTSQLAFPAAASSSTVLPEGHGHGGSGRRPDGTTVRPSFPRQSQPQPPAGNDGAARRPVCVPSHTPYQPPGLTGKIG